MRVFSPRARSTIAIVGTLIALVGGVLIWGMGNKYTLDQRISGPDDLVLTIYVKPLGTTYGMSSQQDHRRAYADLETESGEVLTSSGLFKCNFAIGDLSVDWMPDRVSLTKFNYIDLGTNKVVCGD